MLMIKPTVKSSPKVMMAARFLSGHGHDDHGHHNHVMWTRPFNKRTIFIGTFGVVVVGVGAILASAAVSQAKGGFWFKK